MYGSAPSRCTSASLSEAIPPKRIPLPIANSTIASSGAGVAAMIASCSSGVANVQGSCVRFSTSSRTPVQGFSLIRRFFFALCMMTRIRFRQCRRVWRDNPFALSRSSHSSTWTSRIDLSARTAISSVLK